MIGNITASCAWYVVSALMTVALVSVYADASGKERPPTSPYATCENGPPHDADSFPLAVWPQAP